MKLKNICLAMAFAIGMTSMAHADSGSGTVSFVGSIIDAPCSIDPDNIDQTISLGEISAAQLDKNGKSKPANFTIKLTNCSVSDTEKAVTAKFTGAEGGTPNHLGITGTASGASIGITDGAGKDIELNKDTAAQAFQDGNHTLSFAAYLQGDGAANGVVPGEFKGVTNFTLAYK